jgi:hypothetical protein
MVRIIFPITVPVCGLPDMEYFYRMIVLRPKVNTLFSLSLFTSFCLVAGAVGIAHFYFDDVSWYDYIFLYFLMPLGILLLVRMIFNYKMVTLGNNKITVVYPTRFKEKNYSLADIDIWSETSVKTPSGLYKELQIKFKDASKVRLSFHEHKGYPQALDYLQKKCKKQFKPTPS